MSIDLNAEKSDTTSLDREYDRGTHGDGQRRVDSDNTNRTERCEPAHHIPQAFPTRSDTTATDAIWDWRLICPRTPLASQTPTHTISPGGIVAWFRFSGFLRHDRCMCLSQRRVRKFADKKYKPANLNDIAAQISCHKPTFIKGLVRGNNNEQPKHTWSCYSLQISGRPMICASLTMPRFASLSIVMWTT